MSTILIVILVALMVVMFVSSSMRNKKENEKRMAMLNEMKPGTCVITASGVYGKVVSITETTDGKVVLLSTGKDDKVSYMEIHINAISAIDNKQLVVLDENGNDITPVLNEEESLTETKEKVSKSKKEVKTETQEELNQEEKDSVMNELKEEIEQEKKKSTKKSKKTA